MARVGAILALIATAALMATGCATGPRIDWDSRIGEYTYDQALRDMGPPDRKGELSDGGIVAEWLLQRGSYHGHASTFGPSYRHHGIGFYDYHTVRSPDRHLRLTFNAEKVLQAAERIYR